MEFITYEQPLNEHIRVCLRLEQLFVQIQHWLPGTSQWESRATLAGILEILNVLDRPDLKARLVKELTRFSTQLTRYTETPNVDHSKLNAVLQELNLTIEKLHNMQGRIAQGLRDNDFLISIRQHLANPGGGCSFDAPAYHYWINQPAPDRIAQLTHWLDSLQTVQFSINLMLRLIRQSSSPQWRQANSGFYQAALDANAASQLVRISVPKGSDVYPETSVGRHGISIRFYSLNLSGRAVQTNEDVKFQLTTCVF